MVSKYLHAWDVTVHEAAQIQKRLQPLVQKTNGFRLEELKTVAGIDCSLKDEGQAAIVVLSYPDLQIVDRVIVSRPITFPYVSGFLSFREIPIIMAAMERLQVQPDLLMLDGQGYAHQRRFGIACHLGLLLDRPSIGCAKSVLVGRYAELGPNPGDEALMSDRGETVAMALRTKKNSNPMIISIGHKVDLPTATLIVKSCLRGYRLPETTRLTDKLSRASTIEPVPLPPSTDTNTPLPTQATLF